ncbi:hypothetical protein ACAH01_12710 [Halomicrobium sp. HM KBTZ05]|uniref:hypothetical protein n=1 Tax=Halomicrobium sp. HM KBTZ05 TaxID=3242663 RepID=UPI00355887BE
MNEGQITERALTLAEMAPHESVTVDLLAGRDGRFSPGPPLNEPPVTYLESTEAPAYVLTNGKRGIGLGTKRNTVSPSGDRRTIVLVSGRRTLCLVGQADGDEIVEIPHDAVVSVSYKTGFRANRIALRTPQKTYHCWIHRKAEESLLEAATAFVEDHKRETPEAIDGDDDANRVMYRGRPVTRDVLDDTSAADSDQTVTYRGQPVDDSSE